MPVFVAGHVGPFYAYRPVKKRTAAFWILFPFSIFWLFLVLTWLLMKYTWLSGRWLVLVAIPAMIVLAHDIQDWVHQRRMGTTPVEPEVGWSPPEVGPRDWSPPEHQDDGPRPWGSAGS